MYTDRRIGRKEKKNPQEHHQTRICQMLHNNSVCMCVCELAWEKNIAKMKPNHSESVSHPDSQLVSHSVSETEMER